MKPKTIQLSGNPPERTREQAKAARTLFFARQGIHLKIRRRFDENSPVAVNEEYFFHDMIDDSVVRDVQGLVSSGVTG